MCACGHPRKFHDVNGSYCIGASGIGGCACVAYRTGPTPQNSGGTVTQHPETQRQFQEAAARWQQLKREHEDMCRMQWLGILMFHFTPDERHLLNDYLSNLDRMYLDRAAQLGARGEDV